MAFHQYFTKVIKHLDSIPNVRDKYEFLKHLIKNYEPKASSPEDFKNFEDMHLKLWKVYLDHFLVH